MREQRQPIRAKVQEFYSPVSTINRPVVLLLDTCEWLSEREGEEVGQWVMDELLPQMHERLSQKHQQCSIVIASRMLPTFNVIERQDQLYLSLPMLEQSAVEKYLHELGMDDRFMRQRIYEITHGHALCVSIIGTLWLEQHDHPFTFADLPKLQAQFNERALLEFVQKRLDERLKTPFRELTRYGVLLRSFDLPLLKAIFPEYFSDQMHSIVFISLSVIHILKPLEISTMRFMISCENFRQQKYEIKNLTYGSNIIKGH